MHIDYSACLIHPASMYLYNITEKWFIDNLYHSSGYVNLSIEWNMPIKSKFIAYSSKQRVCDVIVFD